ncbi:DUF2771 domain-containing protein [Streptomyces sp. NPDC005017]|uniref:DUF2771 domain-containing protein n=1 Tax=Streptomyces sp. NPDC005017 TaxID=3364706 RepID=UPI003676AEB5
MTSMQSAVRRRRAVAAAGAVSAGLLVLTACDKPTPVATVTIGSNSVTSEAVCYNDGDPLDAKALEGCAKNTGDIQSIELGEDETVRFGVDPEIADGRWTVLVNGRQFIDFSENTYRTLPGSAFFQAQYGTEGNTNTVTIRMGEKAVEGMWSFKLKNKDPDGNS